MWRQSSAVWVWTFGALAPWRTRPITTGLTPPTCAYSYYRGGGIHTATINSTRFWGRFWARFCDMFSSDPQWFTDRPFVMCVYVPRRYNGEIQKLLGMPYKNDEFCFKQMMNFVSKMLSFALKQAATINQRRCFCT